MAKEKEMKLTTTDGVTTFEATSKEEVEAVAREHFNDGHCWVIDVVFGRVYVKSYSCPSAIPYSAYGDTYQFGHKFWRNGNWIDFPKKTRLKYESTGLGISD